MPIIGIEWCGRHSRWQQRSWISVCGRSMRRTNMTTALVSMSSSAWVVRAGLRAEQKCSHDSYRGEACPVSSHATSCSDSMGGRALMLRCAAAPLSHIPIGLVARMGSGGGHDRRWARPSRRTLGECLHTGGAGGHSSPPILSWFAARTTKEHDFLFDLCCLKTSCS
jgi:hypothetical protein